MKQKRLIPMLLCAIALVFAAIALFANSSSSLGALLWFPLSVLGNALRRLSLSSQALNVVAIVLYAAISLIPAAYAFFAWRKRGFVRADIILYVLCAVLFFALYVAVNPQLLGRIFKSELFASASSYNIALGVIGSFIYSLVLCYVILRLIYKIAAGSTEKLLCCCMYIAYAMCFVLAAVAGFAVGMLVLNAALLTSAADIASEAVRTAVNAVSYVLSIVTALRGARLLSTMQDGMFTQQSVSMAQSLSRICVFALKYNALACVGINAMQLALASVLSNVNISVSVPLTSIFIALFALILSRLITESKLIKDDNDSII